MKLLRINWSLKKNWVSRQYRHRASFNLDQSRTLFMKSKDISKKDPIRASVEFEKVSPMYTMQPMFYKEGISYTKCKLSILTVRKRNPNYCCVIFKKSFHSTALVRFDLKCQNTQYLSPSKHCCRHYLFSKLKFSLFQQSHKRTLSLFFFLSLLNVCQNSFLSL